MPNSSESWRREARIGLCFPVSLLEAPDPEDRPLAEKGSRDQLPWGGGVIKPAGSPLGSPGPARRSQPPLSAPVPESAGGLALPFLMTPCFQEKVFSAPNSCPGAPSPHISQSRGASRSKITQVSSPKASPAGQGHPPGVATRFVLLSECLHQGTPGSPTATAGARLQSSSPPCLTLWELLAPPSDPDTSCFLSL